MTSFSLLATRLGHSARGFRSWDSIRLLRTVSTPHLIWNLECLQFQAAENHFTRAANCAGDPNPTEQDTDA